MSDLDDESAAAQLLERTGFAHASWQQHWEELSARDELPDLAALSTALRTWLSAAYPDWNNRQYESVVACSLARCLGLLAKVRTPEDCGTWLECSKQVMTQVLGGAQ
jgi:hypothetical protein